MKSDKLSGSSIKWQEKLFASKTARIFPICILDIGVDINDRINPDIPEGATTTVPSTQDLRVMTQHSLGKTDVLPIDRFIQKEQNDANGRRIETSAEDREKFFQVQESMNTHTALAKDYTAACERLRLDPKKPLIPGQYVGQSGPEAHMLTQIAAVVTRYDFSMHGQDILQRSLVPVDSNHRSPQ